MKVAVIGAGVAGLGAAWLLSRQHDVVIYERESRFGGHACTVDAPGLGRSQPVDVGFIVFNERNYPNLVALFDHLGVPTKPSDMSFAVSLDGGRFEYGSSFAGFLAQRRNMVRPSFLRMTHDILRFNRLAPAPARQVRGPRLHDRRLRRRCRARPGVPRPLPGADGVLHLVDAARPHARLSGADLRALLQQPRPAHRRLAARLAHGERRQPLLRRAHRGAPAPARAARHAGRRDPPRQRRRPCPRRRRPLGPLRQGDPRLPRRPGAGAADRRRRPRARPARPLRLFLERGLAACRCLVDAAPPFGMVELELRGRQRGPRQPGERDLLDEPPAGPARQHAAVRLGQSRPRAGGRRCSASPSSIRCTMPPRSAPSAACMPSRACATPSSAAATAATASTRTRCRPASTSPSSSACAGPGASPTSIAASAIRRAWSADAPIGPFPLPVAARIATDTP